MFRLLCVTVAIVLFVRKVRRFGGRQYLRTALAPFGDRRARRVGFVVAAYPLVVGLVAGGVFGALSGAVLLWTLTTALAHVWWRHPDPTSGA